MFKRIISNKYGLTIVGMLILAAGIALMSQTKVTCDGHEMSPGDTCTHTRRGNTTVNDYEEEKSSQTLTSLGITGVGGAMTLGGLGWIVVGLIRRREQQPA